MVSARTMPRGGFVALSIVGAARAALAAGETGEKPVELVRAQGMLAIWGLIITGVMMLVAVRLYTYSIRRRWRRQSFASRMSPLQWQARRWRQTWLPRRDRQPPSDDSQT